MEHFLGDQFLSYWGAPMRNPTRPTARFVRRLVLFGHGRAKVGLEPNLKPLFGYGVALHSGTALIGNKDRPSVWITDRSAISSMPRPGWNR